MKKLLCVFCMIIIVLIIAAYCSNLSNENKDTVELNTTASEDRGIELSVKSKEMAADKMRKNVIAEEEKKENLKKISDNQKKASDTQQNNVPKAAVSFNTSVNQSQNPTYIVNKLKSIGSSMQVIVVTSDNWYDTKGTFEAYEKVSGIWKQVFSPRTCALGGHGISTDRHEGDGTTPAGKYTFGTAFGYGGNPGTSMPYKFSSPDDYWVSGKTPDTYNVWITRSGGPDPAWGSDGDGFERLNEPVVYKYGIVINFNTGDGGSTKVMGNGSGIFFHCARPNMTPTAGCVALPEGDVVNVLRWMKPSSNPVIVIGQKDWVIKNM